MKGLKTKTKKVDAAFYKQRMDLLNQGGNDKWNELTNRYKTELASKLREDHVNRVFNFVRALRKNAPLTEINGALVSFRF